IYIYIYISLHVLRKSDEISNGRISEKDDEKKKNKMMEGERQLSQRRSSIQSDIANNEEEEEEEEEERKRMKVPQIMDVRESTPANSGIYDQSHQENDMDLIEAITNSCQKVACLDQTTAIATAAVVGVAEADEHENDEDEKMHVVTMSVLPRNKKKSRDVIGTIDTAVTLTDNSSQKKKKKL
ncbi:hypothetical protein RFI_05703, partial [Reticulomyxa filosa]